MWAWIKCRLLHRTDVMRLPGYAGDEAQCCCCRCGLMWIEDRPDLWAGVWKNQTNAARDNS